METLDDFRHSLSYGSRTDLIFKFVASPFMTEERAAEFLRGLLERLGEALDSGDHEAVAQYCYEQQVSGYTPDENFEAVYKYDDSPWAPLSKPLSESRVALISAGGFYVEGHDPMGPDGPSQEEAILQVKEFSRSAPTLTKIPRDIDPRQLRVRHPGINVEGAVRDHNCLFPIDRMKELQEQGVIGEVAEECYSFVGLSSQKRLLLTAPEWADLLLERGVDAVLLVAA